MHCFINTCNEIGFDDLGGIWYISGHFFEFLGDVKIIQRKVNDT